MRLRKDHYTVCRPDGSIETFSVPSCFGPFEIADKFRHSLTFLHIKKGFSVFADKSNVTYRDNSPVYGPAVILVDKNKFYHVPDAPKTEGEAFHMWKDFGPESN